jgi:hypothetical protein
MEQQVDSVCALPLKRRHQVADVLNASLTHHQVHMFRHHHVREYVKREAGADTSQNVNDSPFAGAGAEICDAATSCGAQVVVRATCGDAVPAHVSPLLVPMSLRPVLRCHSRVSDSAVSARTDVRAPHEWVCIQPLMDRCPTLSSPSPLAEPTLPLSRNGTVFHHPVPWYRRERLPLPPK